MHFKKQPCNKFHPKNLKSITIAAMMQWFSKIKQKDKFLIYNKLFKHVIHQNFVKLLPPAVRPGSARCGAPKIK